MFFFVCFFALDRLFEEFDFFKVPLSKLPTLTVLFNLNLPLLLFSLFSSKLDKLRLLSDLFSNAFTTSSSDKYSEISLILLELLFDLSFVQLL